MAFLLYIAVAELKVVILSSLFGSIFRLIYYIINIYNFILPLALAIHNYTRESRVLSLFPFLFLDAFSSPVVSPVSSCLPFLRLRSRLFLSPPPPPLSPSPPFLSLSHSRLFFNFSLAVLGGERERWPLAGSSLDAVSLQVSFRMRRRERGPSSIYSIRNDAAKVREYYSDTTEYISDLPRLYSENIINILSST